ncbi:MAG: TspO/MBR family protein [Acutalibacteraceae bacterium]
MRKETKSYIIGALIPLIIGGFAAFLTRNSMNLYEEIERPPLSPPSIVFPIVWTILYILMGVSATIINNSGADEKDKNRALLIYVAQLILNFFWSIIFFNFEAYLVSFIVLVLLWVLILLMILSFNKINKTAALLQIPYLLWVTFAGYLNLMIYILNG